MFVAYSNKTTPLFNSSAHRLFWACPLCGFKVDSDREYEVWLAESSLREIIMRDFKVDCVIAVSECPKCHGTSYCHYDLDCMIHATQLGRIKIDLQKLMLERARRRWTIKGLWATNKCKTCANLKKIEKHRYAINVDCEAGGWSRYGSPPGQCDHLKPTSTRQAQCCSH